MLPYRGSLHLADHTSKVLQLIIQYIYGFLFSELQRTHLSLHLVIFEKRSLTLLTKDFTTYHPIYLWVFIFRVAEKGVNKPEYYAIYLIIQTRNPDNRTFGLRASVLVLRSSVGSALHIWRGLGNKIWVGY